MYVGADPEFFIRNIETDTIVSALEILPGSKHEPFKTPHGFVHPDNVAAEIGMPPAQTAEEFDAAVALVMDELAAMLLPFGAAYTQHQVAEMHPMFLMDERAMVAGCEPDFCAYTGEENMSPVLQSTSLRVAGGHVHLGIDVPEEDKPRLIKACDLFISLPMLHLDNPQRRMLYGKAGAYRTKPYGVEYRTPGNGWTFTSARRKWMFEQAEIAAHLYPMSIIPQDLPEIINSHNLSRAAEVIKQYGIEKCPE